MAHIAGLNRFDVPAPRKVPGITSLTDPNTTGRTGPQTLPQLRALALFTVPRCVNHGTRPRRRRKGCPSAQQQVKRCPASPQQAKPHVEQRQRRNDTSVGRSAGTTGAPDARRPAAVVPAPRLCRPHAAHLGTQALRAQETGQGEPAVRGARRGGRGPSRAAGTSRPATRASRPSRGPRRRASPSFRASAAPSGPSRSSASGRRRGRRPDARASRTARPRRPTPASRSRCGALETTRPQDPTSLRPHPQGAHRVR